MGFGLVAVAGVIGIVNILLISIFRRTREFGTLRAIGASDGYLRGMILIENLLIAFVAGICGVLGGLLLFEVVNAAEIGVGNQLIASLLGQSVIKISFSLRSACGAVAAAVALGFTASLYPVQVALRIQPIVAVRRG
jgi:putative ABC transport system permease protein